MNRPVELSVIIPALNEALHIDSLVRSINDLDDTEKEILIVDGGSTDGTPQIVNALSSENPKIRLIENPEKYVSQGFNKAFRNANGKYISLIGAHSVYPKDYFKKCIQEIQSGACEVAGGFLNQEGKTSTGKAISRCMSSKFGVGNTAFRTIKKRNYVDSVAFAVYDRKIFDQVGLLDEELVRNQDDEFHYRLNKNGFRILLLPELEVTYYVRNSIKKLFSQYYQYGYYKPLVFMKVSSGVRLRHLIPSLFVTYMATLPLMFFFTWWIVPLLIYIFLNLIFSFRAKEAWSIKFKMPLIFFVLHTAYGLGFIIGFFKWILPGKN